MKTAVRAPSAAPDEFQQVRRAEFPLVERCVYLNHAASSPLPRRSADALRAYTDAREHPFHLYQAGTPDYDVEPLRRALAGMVNCRAADIGFVPSTSDGLALVANAIDWRAGDNVVIPEGDFPGIFYAFSNIAARGVEIRPAPGPRGQVDVASVLASADARTRVVVVSHVHWTSGFRCDIARLGEACRARGIVFVVDAIQSLGVQPFDTQQIPADVVVAGTYKWLLGIPGVAVLYISPGVRDRLPPDRAGWLSVQTSVHDDPALTWRADALRYLTGAPSEASLIALETSLTLLADFGVDAIQRRIAAVLDALIEGLNSAGAIVRSSLHAEHRSSILSFSTGGPETDEILCRALLEGGIIVGRRGDGIRVAPHFYNNVDDANAVVQVVESLKL